jgi:vacuolar protein sorting-associated protein IST1
LAISRIKLLQNKRDLQLKHMRKEIAQFLQAGQEAMARIRVGTRLLDDFDNYY